MKVFSNVQVKLLALLALALLFTPVSALAQSSQGPISLGPLLRPEVDLISEIYGTGPAVPIARLVFTPAEDGNSGVCALLGLKSAPRGLQAGYFAITRKRQVDGKEVTSRLKFKFPKKPDFEEDGLQIRKACVESDERVSVEELDQIVVAVRQPDRGAIRATERFALQFPIGGSTMGLDLMRKTNGELEASDFTR